MAVSSAPAAALLFDLDGTLADTAPDLGAALNHALAARGLAPIPAAHYRPLVSGGAASLLQAGLDWHQVQLSEAERERLRIRLLEFYQAHIARRTQLFPHVKAMLRRLATGGVGLAVVSNKREYLARQLLQALGVASRFALILGGDSLAQKKPAPEPLWHALRALGSAPSHAVMIGDSEDDLAAARAAGCAMLCVRFGYHPHFLGHRAPPPQADGFLDSYAQLPRALAEIRPRLFAARLPARPSARS